MGTAVAPDGVNSYALDAARTLHFTAYGRLAHYVTLPLVLQTGARLVGQEGVAFQGS